MEVGARGEESDDGQLRTQSLLADSLAIEAAIADNEMGFRCCSQTSRTLRFQLTWGGCRGS